MSKLNQWLTLVANLSVVVGIIFLAVEMRQNTDMMRAQTRDSMTEKQMMFSEWIATTPELAEAWAAGSPDGLGLVPADRRPMLIFWLHGVFRAWENEWYQFERGLFTEDEFTPRMERWRLNMATALYRDNWENTSSVYSPSFRAEIDRIVAELEQAQ